MIYQLHPYAILSLVAVLSNLYLGGYVLLLNLRSRTNRVFALMMLFFAVFAFGAFMMLTALNEATAFFWYKITILCMIFVPAVFVHFALVFPREAPTILANRKFSFLIYIPSIIFAILLSTELFIQKVYYHYLGLYSRIGLAFYLYLLYVVSFALYGFFVLIKSYTRSTTLERKQAKWVVIGACAVMAVSVASDSTPLYLNFLYVPPMSSWFVTVIAALAAYSIIRYKLFIVAPVSEKPIETELKYRLEKGCSYFVSGELEKAYEVYKDQIMHNVQGLCLTKLNPQKIRVRYKVERTPVIWLTFGETDEKSIEPDRLEDMKNLISEFVKRAERSTILIDCFDQLKIVNGFKKTIDFLQDIKGIISSNNSNLIISIAPEMFAEKELASVKKELEEVKIS